MSPFIYSAFTSCIVGRQEVAVPVAFNPLKVHGSHSGAHFSHRVQWGRVAEYFSCGERGMPSKSLQRALCLTKCVYHCWGCTWAAPFSEVGAQEVQVSCPSLYTQRGPTPPRKWCMLTLRTSCTVSADLGEDPFLGGKLDGAVL